MKEELLFNVGITERGFCAVCDKLNMVVGSQPSFEELRDFIKESIKFYLKNEGVSDIDYTIKYHIIPYVVECETVWDETIYLCRPKTQIPKIGIYGNGYTQDEAQKDLIEAYHDITEALKGEGILAPLCVFKFI